MQVENLAGKQIDDFVVQERIGRGGMSVVYRAFQPSVNRQVALKIITLNTDANDPQDNFGRRFAQEAELVAALEHIHILPIYDYGIVNNEIAYIAMRLLRGGSLSTLMKDGPLSLDRTAELFTQVARGIAYAHSKNIIHRDIKPSNILLDDTGNAYVTDFGLAKLIGDSMDITRSGKIVGTPAYMSPEQLRGDSIDHRSDIYSLGVVLYYMLAGRAPFDASDTNLISVIYQHLEKTPPPPSDFNDEIPREVEAVVMRALLKDPSDRFDSASEMADALNYALGRTTSTGSYPALRPITRIPISTQDVPEAPLAPRRALMPVIAAVVVLVALVAVGLIVGQGFGQPAPTPTPPPTATIGPPTVLTGTEGIAADAVPSPEEIERAQARIGDGFLAYIACNLTSEYHATQAREMGDFAAAYGLQYRVYDSDTDKARQIPLIERARADGARLLFICPLDVDLIHGTLTSAQQAGIPMVMLDSDMNTYGGIKLAGDDYLMGRSAGEAAGQIIRDEMGGEANVIILDYPDLPAIVERANGIEDGIKAIAPDANIIGRYRGATPDFALESVSQLLEDGVEFNVIASINDAGSFGAIRALEAAGIGADEVVITSVDAEALAREYILEGYYIRGSVDVGREQFSHAAVDAAVKLLAGSTLPEVISVPPGQVITRETLLAEATAEARASE